MKRKWLLVVLMIMFSFCSCGTRTESTSAATESESTLGTDTSENAQQETKELQDVSKETLNSESLNSEETAFGEEPGALEEYATEETASAQSEAESQTGTTRETEVNNEAATDAVSGQETTNASESAKTPEISGETDTLTAPVSHTCAWDSGVITANATCNSEGMKTYTCVGCGSTKTESIARTSHNYVTESTPATCTEAGKTKTYCSVCGTVQSESVGEAAKGHTPGEKTYWPLAPSCTGAANYNIACSVCGEHLESGTTPALPHTEVATVKRQGNCSVETIISYDCSVCGCPIRTEYHYEDIHDYITGEGEIFNEETLEWEMVSTTYCSRCGKTP